MALAAGDKPIAPFFRFPGLSDSGAMLAYLQERGIAAFTVDVVSNDSFIGARSGSTQRTLEQVERQNGGIVLFHDIKASTAKALPTILAELKKRGYKVVHMRSKSPFAPLPELTAELEAKRAKIAAKEGTDGKPKLVPFYETISPLALETHAEPAVTELAPTARERTHAGGTHATAAAPITPEAAASGDAVEQPARRTRKHRARRAARGASSNQPITNLGAAVSGRF